MKGANGAWPKHAAGYPPWRLWMAMKAHARENEAQKQRVGSAGGTGLGPGLTVGGSGVRT